jgi:tetratricopeptide (TPR) repeat protein
MGNRGEARTALVAAKNADASYNPAAIALAELDYTDGNLDGARRNLAPVIASHPENLRARLTLALTEYKAGNFPAVIEQYRAVIAAGPTAPSASE